MFVRKERIYNLSFPPQLTPSVFAFRLDLLLSDIDKRNFQSDTGLTRDPRMIWGIVSSVSHRAKGAYLILRI